MWIETESNVKPDEIDTTTSKVYNYIHRNICEKDGLYLYEEQKVKKELWDLYLDNESLKKENEALNDTLLAIVEMLDGVTSVK